MLSEADEELFKYIQEMIDMMNTDDQEVNEANKEMLIDQMAEKIKQ